jgi:hypothetical protein
MVEVSNNVLAGLFLIALVVTVIGVASIYTYSPNLTGAATTGTGQANVTITGQVSLTMLQDITNFGDGTPASGTALNISTEEENTNGFNNGSYSNGTDFGTNAENEGFANAMVIENDANQNIQVTITSNASATDFPGGTSQTPLFMYKVLQNESSSCTSLQDVGNWTNTDTSPTTICSSMDEQPSSDTVQVHFLLQIPDDAIGGKIATLTFEAS